MPKLEAADHWLAAPLEEIVRTYAEATGAKLGKVAQPLRAALTGKAVSPPVFDVMAVLGRDEALARIRDQAAEPLTPAAEKTAANHSVPSQSKRCVSCTRRLCCGAKVV